MLPSDSDIENDNYSDENMTDRDNPHDDILDSELVVEDVLFNQFSIEIFWVEIILIISKYQKKIWISVWLQQETHLLVSIYLISQMI